MYARAKARAFSSDSWTPGTAAAITAIPNIAATTATTRARSPATFPYMVDMTQVNQNARNSTAY